MAKFVSPLLGFNNNVRHKNRVFHIQTEDSGVNHPHIITHLFMDGGRILKSVKTSYAEHVGTEKMNETVRGMMKDQHKAMFIALRDGQFDHLLESPAGTKAPAGKAPPPPAQAEPPAQPAPEAVAPGAGARPEDEGATAPAADGPAPKALSPEPWAAPASPVVSASAPSFPTVPAAPPAFTDPPPEIVIARPAPTGEAPSSVRELTLDFDALERASHEPAPTPFVASDLPPPPAALLARGSATGAYRATDLEPRADAKASPAERPAQEQRYAAARPAAIFGERANRPAPPSIFSDELISDKSLDEVILSYLAEDLEPPRRK